MTGILKYTYIQQISTSDIKANMVSLDFIFSICEAYRTSWYDDIHSCVRQQSYYPSFCMYTHSEHSTFWHWLEIAINSLMSTPETRAVVSWLQLLTCSQVSRSDRIHYWSHHSYRRIHRLPPQWLCSIYCCRRLSWPSGMPPQVPQDHFESILILVVWLERISLPTPSTLCDWARSPRLGYPCRFFHPTCHQKSEATSSWA